MSPVGVLASATARSADALHAGRQEVAFYDRIAPMMAANIVPRCFQAHRDAGTNAWHLLLEDLTDTHAVPTQWPLLTGFKATTAMRLTPTIGYRCFG